MINTLHSYKSKGDMYAHSLGYLFEEKDWINIKQALIIYTNTVIDLEEKLAEQAERVTEGNGSEVSLETEAQEPVAVVEDWTTDKTPKGIVALGDIKELPAGTLLYASPATSTEVFTREKVDSLLIAAYTKGRNDLLEKQAEQEPVAYDWDTIHQVLCEVWNRDSSADEGLEAIQDLIYSEPTIEAKEPVARVPAHPEQGLEWLKPPPVWGTLLYAAPVRTKDLTDSEIEAICADLPFDENFDITVARAVIAADREKNKCQ